MRPAIVFFFLFVLAPAVGLSQSLSCEREFEVPGFDFAGKEVPGHPAPIFEFWKPFESPVRLPVHVLALLLEDDVSRSKLQVCSEGGVSQVPPKWLTARELKLVDGELPGLMVKAANSCVWKPGGEREAGYFWLFRQSPTGYQLVFRENTHALQVLNRSTAGYPNLCTIEGQETDSSITQKVYTFEDGKYQEAISTHIIQDDFGAPPEPGGISLKPSPEHH